MVVVDLVQPRHNYAPPVNREAFGQVYLPSSLLTAGARLLDAGVDINLHDENIGPRRITSQYVGISLLGSPYIPEAIRIQAEIDQERDSDVHYLVGGQVISGLTPEQFRRLFGDSAHNGNDDEILASTLGIPKEEMKPPERTSLIRAYDLIPDETMMEYLSRELTIFVSQGCKYACDFCGAVRSSRDPVTGDVVKVKEVYRDPEIIREELSYLVRRAKGFGLNELNFYMSNLDIFQTPSELRRFAQSVKQVRSSHPDFDVRFRGLATVESYLNARDNDGDSIQEVTEAGFHTVGFGVDGMTPAVWRAIHKGMNTKDKCLEAIRSSREDYGLTPEVLMVFGHSGIDTEDTLRHAYDFTVDMVQRYGAVPRPHVSKSAIPGNSGWNDPRNAEMVSSLIEHPESFQTLDFTALPSEITHPDRELRELTTRFFLEIISITENTTKYVKPITPDLSPEEIEEVKRFNEGRYDR